MGFAERAVLLDRSDAVWRMGHGSPTPYELVTGSGMPDLLRESLDLMRRLVLDHKRFVFVPSATSARELLTIGNALEPLEYAVIDTNEATLGRIAEGHYRGETWGVLRDDVERFVKDCGPRLLTGVYRASRFAPCQMFYAHAEHVHEAALIAMKSARSPGREPSLRRRSVIVMTIRSAYIPSHASAMPSIRDGARWARTCRVPRPSS